mmetsp:Transcript_35163/g.59244  ORF Transcript_35163/g.59244 Transcript_35163/m.59244 type:complete len:214 (+) Transcript_35163:1073-1714(+)
MVEKMRRSCASEGIVILMAKNTACTRWLKGLRPPPGGAMDVTSCMSLIIFTSCFSRSYQNPLSDHSLSSSSGGRKPKTDLAGMLKSSMKHRSFLPPIGANTPFVRFSSLPSMVTCSELDVVCADMLITMAAFESGRSEMSFCTTMVLPTPTLPKTMAWRKVCTRLVRMKAVRTVSTVGTMMRKKGMLGSTLKLEDSFCSQEAHAFALGSSQYS